MSYVDDIFISDLKEILDEDWEIDNRAKWNDDVQTKTKRIIQSLLRERSGFVLLFAETFKSATDGDNIVKSYPQKVHGFSRKSHCEKKTLR